MGGIAAYRQSEIFLPSEWTLSASERWYVVRTRVQREFQAATQLTNQGFRNFVPCCLKNRRHARRVETISAPLFPRYIFAIVDCTRDRWRSINGTWGVDRLLTFGGEPRPLPRGLVEGLILATDADGNVQFDCNLHEGQSIKILAGPFVDLVGRLEGLDDKGRVRVLLEILGGSVRVNVPARLVAPY